MAPTTKRYRLRSDPSKECEARPLEERGTGDAWWHLTLPVSVASSRHVADVATVPKWLFEAAWEPVPEAAPPEAAESGYEVVLDDDGSPAPAEAAVETEAPRLIEEELDEIVKWKGGCVFDWSRMDAALKRAAAEIRDLRRDYMRFFGEDRVVRGTLREFASEPGELASDRAEKAMAELRDLRHDLAKARNVEAWANARYAEMCSSQMEWAKKAEAWAKAFNRAETLAGLSTSAVDPSSAFPLNEAIERLTAENAKLKAEVERYTTAHEHDAAMKEKYVGQIRELKAQVEALSEPKPRKVLLLLPKGFDEKRPLQIVQTIEAAIEEIPRVSS